MKSVFAAVLLAAAVSAHGTMSKMVADGKEYTDNIRAINSVEPTTDFNADSMTCGHGSAAASGVAEVKAGGMLEFQMKNGEGGPWVHLMGPVMYSAFQCDGDAASCNPGKDANWAVIGQNGDDGAGKWQMEEFTHGVNVKVPIPAGMPNGDYVIRQELIAIHNKYEMYIQCVNVKVTGGIDGTLKDAGAELVAYPGAYSGSEPGFSFNPYGVDPKTYPMPGPALFTGGSAAPPTPPQPTAAPEPEPTAAPEPEPTAAPVPVPSCKAPVRRANSRLFRM